MESKIWNGYTVYEDGTVIGKRGKEVGNINKGYKRIDYKRKHYLVHRIVYELFVGELDENFVIDHIDSNKLNNHHTNLRLVTIRINSSKKERSFKCSSIYPGVNFFKPKKRWVSRIWDGDKRLFLGSFKTEEEAHQAYQTKLEEIKKTEVANFSL